MDTTWLLSAIHGPTCVAGAAEFLDIYFLLEKDLKISTWWATWILLLKQFSAGFLWQSTRKNLCTNWSVYQSKFKLIIGIDFLTRLDSDRANNQHNCILKCDHANRFQSVRHHGRRRCYQQWCISKEDQF